MLTPAHASVDTARVCLLASLPERVLDRIASRADARRAAFLDSPDLTLAECAVCELQHEAGGKLLAALRTAFT